jgi:hypothetical protein
MRIAFLALGLLALAGCVQPVPNQTAANKVDGTRFTQPTNGAAYSQDDMYYYRTGSSTGYQGPSGGTVRTSK